MKQTRKFDFVMSSIGLSFVCFFAAYNLVTNIANAANIEDKVVSLLQSSYDKNGTKFAKYVLPASVQNGIAELNQGYEPIDADFNVGLDEIYSDFSLNVSECSIESSEVRFPEEINTGNVVVNKHYLACEKINRGLAFYSFYYNGEKQSGIYKIEFTANRKLTAIK